MGLDRTQTLAGLLRPDPRFELWDAESGEYDAAGGQLATLQGQTPVAGVPARNRATQLALRAYGSQEESLRVHSTRAGLPLVDRAGMLWRPLTAPDSQLRGSDMPSTCLSFEGWHIAGTTYYAPHVVRLDTDALLGVWWRSGNGIWVRRRDADGTLQPEVLVSGITAFNPYPCLLQDPDSGRVYLYCWRAGTNYWTIQAFYSDDDGDTWSQIGDVLEETISAATYPTVYRLRVAGWNGQVCLVGHLRLGAVGVPYRDVLGTWAASDGGVTFRRVAIQSGNTDHGIRPDIVTLPSGGFLVAAIRWDTAAGSPVVALWQLGSADEALGTVGEISNTSAAPGGTQLGTRAGGPANYTLDDADLALVQDDDGSQYLLVRAVDGAAFLTWCPVLRSTDDGVTWNACGESTRYAGPGQSWSDLHTDQLSPEDWAAVAQRGRVVVLSGHRRLGAITGSLSAYYLGGFSTHPMPARGGFVWPTTRVAWDRPWYGIGAMDEAGYAAAGPGVVSLVLGGVSIVGARTYTDPLGAATTGVLAECSVTPAAASSGQVRIITDSGAAGRHIQVLFNDISIQAFDGTTGAPVAAAVAVPAARYRIRVDLLGADVLVWACADTTYEDRLWTLIASGALADHGGGVGPVVEWLTTAGTVVWHEGHYSEGLYAGDHWHTWGPQERMPRSVVPSGVWLGRGVRTAALTGPTIHGDTWDIVPTWEYPPEALDSRQYPSPSHPWRSRLFSEMDPTTDHIRISYRVGTAVERTLGELMAAWADGMNVGEVELWLRYGGAWHYVATVGTDDVALSVYGQTMTPRLPTPGGAATWRRDELADAGVEVIDPGTGLSLWTGRIEANTPGSTRTSGTALRPDLVVTTSTAGLAANVEARLWPRRALLAWLASDFATEIQGAQLRIPVRLGVGPWVPPGPPPEGYAEIGCLEIGAVWAWGRPYGFGRRLDHEPGTELVTAEDGTRSAVEHHEVRRVVELSWPDGVPGGDWLTGTAPDYVTADTGGTPVAWWRDTPVDVADQLRALAGAATIVVYLPEIDRPPTTGYHHWGRGAVRGRVTDAVALDGVRGQEGSSEGWRLQALVIEEEL